MLFIKIMKRTGPRTLPWGTPLITGLNEEKEEPTLTLCILSVKNELMQDNNFPVMPKCSKQKISLGMETESKAFAKSMYAARLPDLSSRFFVQSFKDSIRLVQVECLDKKPCCEGLR